MWTGGGLAGHLATADIAARVAVLGDAVDTLLTLQTTAATTALMRSAPRIGVRAGWVDDLMAVPVQLAAQRGLPSAALDPAILGPILSGQPQSFVKWDARPENALVRQDGSLCWFDWDHCGLRARADDLVWLLADEWAPAPPDVEGHAIDRVTALQGGTRRETQRYMACMGVLRSCVRLSLIFKYKGDGGWWDHATCLRLDRVGVTAAHVDRLCRRALRWVDDAPELAGLGPLFPGAQAQVA